MSRPLVEVEGLAKHFPGRRGLLGFGRGAIRAVDGISFSIARGEVVGLVGESGSGKSTVGRAVLRLLEEKISMFELVVGEAGAILGSLEDEREFPDLVLDAWLETTDQGREAALTALGARLDAARREHEDAKALDERLFGQDFATA